MRVGFVSPPWAPVPPPAYGGTEAVVDRLARGVQAAGHEVVLYATGESTSPVPTRAHLDEAPGDEMGTLVPEAWQVVRAYDALRGCDVVHDHTVLGPLYAARFPDLPVVTTIHGPFDDAMRDVYRAIAAHVPVIAISRRQARDAGDVPVERVIHHGIDPERYPVGPGGGHLLFLGRMTPDKGVHRAIEVARRVGVPLVIAAKMREPAEHDYFEAEIRPRLGTGVEFIGEACHDRKVELLGDACALVNPIRWPEPFGLVMVESLACGTPVLAFPEGAAPEIVDDGTTGFLCRDEDEMAARVGDIGRIDRAACRAAVEERFSTTRMVAEHLEVYDAVRRRRPATCGPTARRTSACP